MSPASVFSIINAPLHFLQKYAKHTFRIYQLQFTELCHWLRIWPIGWCCFKISFPFHALHYSCYPKCQHVFFSHWNCSSPCWNKQGCFFFVIRIFNLFNPEPHQCFPIIRQKLMCLLSFTCLSKNQNMGICN